MRGIWINCRSWHFAIKQSAMKYLKLSSLRSHDCLSAVASTPQLGAHACHLTYRACHLCRQKILLPKQLDSMQPGPHLRAEVTKVLNNSSALRAANTNLVFKSVGTLAGAWVTNRATDALVDTKHGPSMVTWAADIAAPAILFTNKSMLMKFGVVTSSHLVAKLYDKWTEKE